MVKLQFRVLYKRRRNASLQATKWIKNISPTTSELADLKDLGLLLCRCICEGRAVGKNGHFVDTRLPKPSTFVELTRSCIVSLAQAISLSDPGRMSVKENSQHQWGKIFGGIALSYARVGDLSAVAALIRAAARLRLHSPWLNEAETYVLDQQQPEGYFGLISTELAMMESGVDIANIQLRLSVEVLWALAETASILETDTTRSGTKQPPYCSALRQIML